MHSLTTPYVLCHLVKHCLIAKWILCCCLYSKHSSRPLQTILLVILLCPHFDLTLLVKTFHCSFIDRISIWHFVFQSFFQIVIPTEGFSYPMIIPLLPFLLNKFFFSTCILLPPNLVSMMINEWSYLPTPYRWHHISSSWLFLNHLKAQVILRKCSWLITQCSISLSLSVSCSFIMVVCYKCFLCLCVYITLVLCL